MSIQIEKITHKSTGKITINFEEEHNRIMRDSIILEIKADYATGKLSKSQVQEKVAGISVSKQNELIPLYLENEFKKSKNFKMSTKVAIIEYIIIAGVAWYLVLKLADEAVFKPANGVIGEVHN